MVLQAVIRCHTSLSDAKQVSLNHRRLVVEGCHWPQDVPPAPLALAQMLCPCHTIRIYSLLAPEGWPCAVGSHNIEMKFNTRGGGAGGPPAHAMP